MFKFLRWIKRRSVPSEHNDWIKTFGGSATSLALREMIRADVASEVAEMDRLDKRTPEQREADKKATRELVEQMYQEQEAYFDLHPERATSAYSKFKAKKS